MPKWVRGYALCAEFSDRNCYFPITPAPRSCFLRHAIDDGGESGYFRCDQGGQICFVLTAQNAERGPSAIVNSIGVPALQLGAKLSVEAIPRLFE